MEIEAEWNDEVQALFNAVMYYQTLQDVHPLTCGVDSKHDVLIPIIVGNNVILQCPTCKWVQRDWPVEPVVARASKFNFNDPMNDPEYRPKVMKFLDECLKEGRPRPSPVDIIVNCGLPQQAQDMLSRTFSMFGNYKDLLRERQEWGKIFYEELKHRLRNGMSGDDFINFKPNTVLYDTELSGVYRAEDDILLIFRTLIGTDGECDDCGKECDPCALWCEECYSKHYPEDSKTD